MIEGTGEVNHQWSKGWAYTDTAAWADPAVLGGAIPASLPGWSGALETLRRHDPHGVFAGPLEALG